MTEPGSDAAAARPDDRGDRELRALLVDYGGVLTSPLQDTMAAWCEADGLDPGEVVRVLRESFGPSYGEDAAANPVHALERGELAIPDFERQLAAHLRTRDGRPVPADGLLRRMFSAFGREQGMVAAVRHAHDQGVRTALVSNSWGLDYPRDDWPELFDAVVISGEVGMRKPEPEIYRYAAQQLGVEPAACVFVDDLPTNVQGAVAVGMVGVRHRTPEETVDELEALLGLRLRSAAAPA